MSRAPTEVQISRMAPLARLPAFFALEGKRVVVAGGTEPAAWKAALFGGKIIDYLPTKMLPIPALRAWEGKRTLPGWRGGEFRKWLKGRARPLGAPKDSRGGPSGPALPKTP